MKEINFSEIRRRMGKLEATHGYELSDKEQYFVKYTEDFFLCNVQTCSAIEMCGGVAHPDSFRVVNDFNTFMSKLCTKSAKQQQQFLKERWGKQFLWDNNFTRGIVVKLTEPDDITDFTYHVLVECSCLCTGFKYTKFIPSDSYTQEAVKEVLSNVSATY